MTSLEVQKSTAQKDILAQAASAKSAVRSAAASSLTKTPKSIEVGSTPIGVNTSTRRKKEIESWKSEQLSKVDRQQKRALDQLSLDYSKAKADLLPQLDVSGLASEEVGLLNQGYGVEEINRRRKITAEETAVAEMLSESERNVQGLVLVAGNQYLTREDYDSLSDKDKSLIDRIGIEAYNAVVDKRNKKSQEAYEIEVRAQGTFEAENFEIAKDVWLPNSQKTLWSSLTASQKKEVIETGSYTPITSVEPVSEVISPPTSVIVPPSEEDIDAAGRTQFEEMQSSGEIPQAAIYTGVVDNQITYQTTVSSEEQTLKTLRDNPEFARAQLDSIPGQLNNGIPMGTAVYEDGKLDVDATWAKLTTSQRAALMSHTGHTIVDVLKGVAGFIPVVGTVVNWNEMSSTGRGLSIAGDVLMLAPFVGWTLRSGLSAARLSIVGKPGLAAKLLQRSEIISNLPIEMALKDRFGVSTRIAYGNVASVQRQLVSQYGRLYRLKELQPRITGIPNQVLGPISTLIKRSDVDVFKLPKGTVSVSDILSGSTAKTPGFGIAEFWSGIRTTGLEPIITKSSRVLGKGFRWQTERTETTISRLNQKLEVVGSKYADLLLGRGKGKFGVSDPSALESLRSPFVKTSYGDFSGYSGIPISRLGPELVSSTRSAYRETLGKLVGKSGQIRDYESRIENLSSRLRHLKESKPNSPEAWSDVAIELQETISELSILKAGDLPSLYKELFTVRGRIPFAKGKELDTLLSREEELQNLVSLGIRNMYVDWAPESMFSSRSGIIKPGGPVDTKSSVITKSITGAKLTSSPSFTEMRTGVKGTAIPGSVRNLSILGLGLKPVSGREFSSLLSESFSLAPSLVETTPVSDLFTSWSTSLGLTEEVPTLKVVKPATSFPKVDTNLNVVSETMSSVEPETALKLNTKLKLALSSLVSPSIGVSTNLSPEGLPESSPSPKTESKTSTKTKVGTRTKTKTKVLPKTSEKGIDEEKKKKKKKKKKTESVLVPVPGVYQSLVLRMPIPLEPIERPFSPRPVIKKTRHLVRKSGTYPVAGFVRVRI